MRLSSMSLKMGSARSTPPGCTLRVAKPVVSKSTAPKGTAIHTPIGSDNLSLSLGEAVEGYTAGSQDVTITRSSTSPSLLRELAACIEGKKQPDYTLAHDRAVQRTLFAGCGITDGVGLRGIYSEI